MKVGQLFLIEWERESASTLKMLERVPEEKLSWKPHEKSRSLGSLALHVSALPLRWMHIFDNDTFDPTVVKQPQLEKKEEFIKLFEDGSTKLTERFRDTDESEYDKPFTFLVNGKEMFIMPKAMGLRVMLLNHLIHHRAQLSVYLRLIDIPVPGMYGMSADEAQI